MPYISFDQLSPLSCRLSPQVARDRIWAYREPRSGSVEVISCEPAIRSRGRSDSARSRGLRQRLRRMGRPAGQPLSSPKAMPSLPSSSRGRPPMTDSAVGHPLAAVADRFCGALRQPEPGNVEMCFSRPLYLRPAVNTGRTRARPRRPHQVLRPVSFIR